MRPWLDGEGGTGRRAGRVYLFVGLVAVAVVPAMIAHYGADGWLWHITASVLFFAPLVVVGVDALAERIGARGAAPPAETAGAGARPSVVSRGRPSGARPKGPARLALLFAGAALGIFVGYAVPVLVPIFPTPSVRVLLADYGRSMAIVTPVLVAVGAAGALLWYRGEAFRLETAAAVASFHALKDQLQPHFLFNALGSLKELIADDPRLAGEMTQRLADLYRLILQASASPTIALRDELALVDAYLALERMRYGDRLEFTIGVSDELSELHVPSLMLQTLAENAVKHGICKARRGGTIRIEARRAADGWLELEVANTGAPYAQARRNAGTGLANTAARLELMYGARSRFVIASEGGETRASFAVSGEAVR